MVTVLNNCYFTPPKFTTAGVFEKRFQRNKETSMSYFEKLAPLERERLQHSWAKQLYLDFERITYQHRLSLQPAVMVVGAFTTPLARWDGHTRTIALSFDLLAGFPWAVVLEVLKHEMAHQLVEEVFRQSCDHGSYFRQAGALLGLQAWAMRACLDLQVLTNWRSSTALNTEQQRLLSRAQKLLALAQSANQWEAELAMQKAHRLYADCHLASLEALDRPAFISTVIEQGQKRIHTYQSLIASLLVKFFHVQVIHLTCYNAQAETSFKALELLGLPHQLEMAEYVYYFLDGRAKSLWREYQKEVRVQKGLRPSSFYQGVIAGFSEKLEEQRQAEQASCSPAGSDSAPGAGLSLREQQLILKQEEERLLEFMNYRHPRLRNVQVGAGRGSSSLFSDGLKKGRQLVLHPPLKQGSSGVTGFLNKARGS